MGFIQLHNIRVTTLANIMKAKAGLKSSISPFQRHSSIYYKQYLTSLQRRLRQFSKINLTVIKSSSLLKHCYLTMQKKKQLITPLSEGSKLNQQTIHTTVQAFWDNYFYWINGAVRTKYTHYRRTSALSGCVVISIATAQATNYMQQ